MAPRDATATADPSTFAAPARAAAVSVGSGSDLTPRAPGERDPV